jgi:preprotein translocase subunit SecA
VEDIKEHNKRGQPVLVGTTSVEKSEILSDMLRKEGVKHEVLNAKYHEKEAKIISTAGQKGSVTIATNMAGRGTDIALGEGVKELGGLYIIGSERHESRRIDNQLRGRSGRQGDPGESRFYVSFEDDLMRLFGGDKMSVIMSQVGMDDDMPIAVNILGRTIENAQKKVESHNYDIRKRLVDFDDVLNQQRDVIYGMRTNILSIVEDSSQDRSEGDIKKDISFVKSIDMNEIVNSLGKFSLSERNSWEIEILKDMEYKLLPLEISILKKILNRVDFLISSQLKDDMQIDNIEERKLYIEIKNLLTENLFEKSVKDLGYKNSIEFFRENDGDEDLIKKRESLLKLVFIAFVNHIYTIGVKPMFELSKLLTLQSIDRFWMEHLTTMSDLREGISLRNLAQRDPLVEYKNEGFRLFEEMLNGIDESIVNRFFKVRLVRREDVQRGIESKENDNRPGKVGKQRTITKGKKVGRNDPCPCGSGKKYKKCCYPKYG